MLIVGSYLGDTSAIFIRVRKFKWGVCYGPTKYIDNGGVLLQKSPSEKKHAGEWSELLRYFCVVYLKTTSATE
jgi:hypothetical protein